MPHTLLLADDSVTIRRVIELTFADESVKVLSVSSGREALERIASERPDIVLADIGMADVSGYEIAAFIKGRDDLRHIPVVLLAGAFEPLDEAKARQAGSDAVLVKPFEPQMVVARVRELLARPAGVPAPPPARSPSPPPMPAAAPVAMETPLPAPPSARSMPLDPEPVRAASGSTDTDPLFDESLDRLDAAFAGAHGPSLDADVVSDFAKDLKELRSARPETGFAREEFGDWDLPSRAAPPAPADEARPVATFEGTAPRQAEPPPEPPPPVILPPPVALEPRAPVRAASAPPPPPVAAPPLADAFSSLLAAEEGRPYEPVPETAFLQMPAHAVRPLPAPAVSAPPASGDLSDEAIDKIVDKVVARLGAGVRGTVLDLAERLVRAEIDRLKAMR